MDVKKYQEKLDFKQILAPNGHCRLWTGTSKMCSGTKYGVINVKVGDGRWRQLFVHRLAFQFFKGWALEDMDLGAGEGTVVSHLCHNSLCVNPDHLAWESQATNTSRNACVINRQCSQHGGQPDCLLHLKI